MSRSKKERLSVLNPLLIAGMSVVNLALISYTIAIILESRSRAVTGKVMSFYLTGIFLDLSATCLMILGSHRIPITLHGLLGYSALTVMLVDIFWLRQFRRKNGKEARIPNNLHFYSLGAYGWWVAAYIAGAMLVMWAKR